MLNRALQLCLREGARLADAGEFTRRAFLNGRIDLSQAEAVMSMITARGEQEHKAAVRQLNGGASFFIRNISDELYSLQAGLAACIDYPDEISDEEGAGALKEGLEKLIRKLGDAIDEHSSRLIHQGLRIALIGRPNVGKSSILNALLGEERAIVTDIPGTTRDTVQGEITLNGIRILLTDTAGIRDTEDPVERIGVERSVKAMEEADASLLILDGSFPLSSDDIEIIRNFHGEGAAVINKSDLETKIDDQYIRSRITHVVSISAKNDKDTAALENAVAEIAGTAELDPSQGILANERQYNDAMKALNSVDEAIAALEMGITFDAVTIVIEESINCLLELTGERVTEAVVDKVFSNFCVGK